MASWSERRPESAAGKAGIEEQDIITAINGTEIKNSTELRKFLYTELKVGDKATFTIYRGAEVKNELNSHLTSNPHSELIDNATNPSGYS